MNSGASRISNSPAAVAVDDCSRRSMEEAPPRHRGVLPEDALYEILLRLPGKTSAASAPSAGDGAPLLSEPHLIAAHAARNPEPLAVVGFQACKKNGPVLCDVVDLSGRVVKRVHAAGYDDAIGTNWVSWVMYTHADLICVTDSGIGMSCQLLNLGTGAVHDLPDGVAAEHDAQVQEQAEGLLCYYCVFIVFGLIPSTGEYKVLRMVEVEDEDDDLGNLATSKLYEVLTIDNGSSSQEARWRGTQAPPYDLDDLLYPNSMAVISGIVYFMLSHDHWDYFGTNLGHVGSFDLETEKWRSSIPGPSSCHRATLKDIKIAALSGHLAFCCRTSSSSEVSPTMDIWFLTDIHKGLWVKQHSIKVSLLQVPNVQQPLLMLKDERIANHMENWAFLQNYNQDHIPKNLPQMKRYVAVGLYGGTLLNQRWST